jgi:hypothetical protein
MKRARPGSAFGGHCLLGKSKIAAPFWAELSRSFENWLPVEDVVEEAAWKALATGAWNNLTRLKSYYSVPF